MKKYRKYPALLGVFNNQKKMCPALDFCATSTTQGPKSLLRAATFSSPRGWPTWGRTPPPPLPPPLPTAPHRRLPAARSGWRRASRQCSWSCSADKIPVKVTLLENYEDIMKRCPALDSCKCDSLEDFEDLEVVLLNHSILTAKWSLTPEVLEVGDFHFVS